HNKNPTDREPANEKLRARTNDKSSDAPVATPGASGPEPARNSFFNEVIGAIGSIFKPTVGPRGGVHESVATSMVKSAARAASSQVGRQVVRGLLGGVLRGSRR